MGFNRYLYAAAAILSTAPIAVAAQPDAPATLVVTGRQEEERGRWIKAEAQNFIIYATDEKQARETANKLERFHQVLTLLTGATPRRETTAMPVYLVRGSDAIGRLRRQAMGPGLYASGYYSASPTGALLAADMDWDLLYPRTPSSSDVWLFEEYARHFIAQSGRSDNLPDWYVTGFTLVMATMQFHKDRIEYGIGHPNLSGRLESAKWEPMERIIAGGLDHGMMYSAQAMLLVHYILAKPERRAAFDRFVASVHAGQPSVPAFELAFKMTMKALQAELQVYLHQAGYNGATLTGFVMPDVLITHLPRSADAVLLDEAAMRIGIPEADRQRAVLLRAEKAFAETHDSFAALTLARAQVLYGDRAKADPTLDRLLAANPQDAQVLYLKGMRHLMAGQRGTPEQAAAQAGMAQRWLVKAHQVDGENSAVLYAWVASLAADPQFLSDGALNALLRAAYLAPQATQIQISAALMMMARGQFDDAIALLSPITITPRDPASMQTPALLAQARAKRQPDIATVAASFSYTATWRDLNCC